MGRSWQRGVAAATRVFRFVESAHDSNDRAAVASRSLAVFRCPERLQFPAGTGRRQWPETRNRGDSGQRPRKRFGAGRCSRRFSALFATKSRMAAKSANRLVQQPVVGGLLSKARRTPAQKVIFRASSLQWLQHTLGLEQPWAALSFCLLPSRRPSRRFRWSTPRQSGRASA